jgi:hypothetical protein
MRAGEMKAPGDLFPKKTTEAMPWQRPGQGRDEGDASSMTGTERF